MLTGGDERHVCGGGLLKLLVDGVHGRNAPRREAAPNRKFRQGFESGFRGAEMRQQLPKGYPSDLGRPDQSKPCPLLTLAKDAGCFRGRRLRDARFGRHFFHAHPRGGSLGQMLGL